MISDTDLILRLLVSAAFGAVVGTERQLSEEAAGFRTHLLVALGSCLFTLMSGFGLANSPDLRVAAQVVTGVGFLGAGAILRSGFGVRGLATAASLWVVAALGMATALGYYPAAATVTVLAVITLRGAKWLEAGLMRFHSRQVEVTIRGDQTLNAAELVAQVTAHGGLIRDVRVDEATDGRSVSFYFEMARGRSPEVALAVLRQAGNLEHANWTL
jgi:putative Mg2+ transporter-C (MgtC) family protein